MAITAGQPIVASDFISTSSGAGDSGKAPKLNASGQIADGFINQSGMIGVLANSVVKTWFTFQMTFILWIGSTLGAATTDFPMWSRTSTKTIIKYAGGMADFTSTAAEMLVSGFDSSNMIDGRGNSINFSGSKKLVLDFFANMAATNTGDINLGFGDFDHNSMLSAYNGTTYNRVVFNLKSTGELYATIAKGGTGVTNTDISSGITVSNWNHYRIELDCSSQARFYVNGVLKATLSGANLPSTGNLTLGFGRSNTAAFAVTAPNFALQLI